MRTFKKVFSIKMLEELQYKGSFISGFLCQFAFGLMYIMLYRAFFENGIPQDFSLVQMASYIWLGQLTFAMLSFRDINKKDITDHIMNGNVGYQMIKPIGLYKFWFFQVFSKAVSACILRAAPMLLIIALLPKGWGISLPTSFLAFVLFVISIVLAVVLISAIKMIIYAITLHTLDSRGVFCTIPVVCEIFSGKVVPIPLLPIAFQKVLNFMPFRYAADLPFRIYIGNLTLKTSAFQILIQLIWIALLIIIGLIMINQKSKKLVVQGG